MRKLDHMFDAANPHDFKLYLGHRLLPQLGDLVAVRISDLPIPTNPTLSPSRERGLAWGPETLSEIHRGGSNTSPSYTKLLNQTAPRTLIIYIPYNPLTCHGPPIRIPPVIPGHIPKRRTRILIPRRLPPTTQLE